MPTEYIYETERFYVDIVKFIDPVLNEELEGYGIFNKETGVREAETRRLHSAQQLTNKFEEDAAFDLEKALRAAPAANELMI